MFGSSVGIMGCVDFGDLRVGRLAKYEKDMGCTCVTLMNCLDLPVILTLVLAILVLEFYCDFC